MRETILNFPKQFAKGIGAAQKISLKQKYSRAIICGMGGSSIPGYILEMAYPKANIQIHPSFDLPSDNFSKETLVLCISWSGNTEETISSYKTAVASGMSVVIITSGGKLKELGSVNNSPIVLMTDDKIMPRNAAGYMYGTVFQILKDVGILDDIRENLETLERLISEKRIEALETRAKQIAENIGDKIPLIYTSYSWRNQAGFWKIFFNENAKIHSFWNSMPSLAHNELAGFNKKDAEKFFIIFLNDKDADNRYKDSLEKLEGILEETGYAHDLIDLEGSSITEKIFTNYILAAFASFYLAKKLGADPESMEMIEKFKTPNP